MSKVNKLVKYTPKRLTHRKISFIKSPINKQSNPKEMNRSKRKLTSPEMFCKKIKNSKTNLSNDLNETMTSRNNKNNISSRNNQICNILNNSMNTKDFIPQTKKDNLFTKIKDQKLNNMHRDKSFKDNSTDLIKPNVKNVEYNLLKETYIMDCPKLVLSNDKIINREKTVPETFVIRDLTIGSDTVNSDLNITRHVVAETYNVQNTCAHNKIPESMAYLDLTSEIIPENYKHKLVDKIISPSSSISDSMLLAQIIERCPNEVVEFDSSEEERSLPVTQELDHSPIFDVTDEIVDSMPMTLDAAELPIAFGSTTKTRDETCSLSFNPPKGLLADRKSDAKQLPDEVPEAMNFSDSFSECALNIKVNLSPQKNGQHTPKKVKPVCQNYILK